MHRNDNGERVEIEPEDMAKQFLDSNWAVPLTDGDDPNVALAIANFVRSRQHGLDCDFGLLEGANGEEWVGLLGRVRDALGRSPLGWAPNV